MGTLDGCYLFYDTITNRFIRAGKANKTFLARFREHVSNSKKPSASSMRFYKAFPSKTAPVSTHPRRGYFENLKCYAGIAFDSGNEQTVDALCTDARQYPDLGVFEWDSYTMNRLSKYKSDTVTQEKQLEFCAYLLELSCALSLSPDANISEGPSFEGPLGHHSKAHRR